MARHLLGRLLSRTAPALAVVESWRRAKKPQSRCEDGDPVVVLGGGVMGLSTAWSLARSGVKVTLLDAGHAEKGSWGESRIARVSYADPMLVRLARRSYELYDALAKESGEELMYTTGCLDVGFTRESLDSLAETYEELGQSYERLTHRQVAQRWPMLQLSKEYVEASVFCPNGDAVLASVVLDTLKEQLIRLALAQYMEQAVLEIDRNKKTVTLEDGRSIKYSKLVVAAGIWTNHVLKAMDLALLPLVTSIEQQTYYATPEGSEMYSSGRLPVIIEHNPAPEPQMKRRGGYMIPHLPDGVDGVKFGMHRQGPLMDHKDFPVPPGSTAAVDKIFAASATRGKGELWVQRWPEEEDRHLRQETDAFARRVLPSLRTAKAAELTMRCPYDQQLYSDEDFVVGLHPKDPNLLVVCGFAGEGFKFGPAIGELAACLVTGRPFAVPESLQRFRLDRPCHVVGWAP